MFALPEAGQAAAETGVHLTGPLTAAAGHQLNGAQRPERRHQRQLLRTLGPLDATRVGTVSANHNYKIDSFFDVRI